MPLFSDIDGTASDFFSDDYTKKVTCKIKTKAGPVGVTCETERKTKGSTSLLSKLSFKWAAGSGFAIDKLSMKPDGSHVMETSLTGVAPGLKFTFKGDDAQNGDLGLEYKKDAVGVTAEMDIIELKQVSASLAAAKGDLAFGGSATYKISGGALDAYSVAASYTAGSLFASVVSDKFSSFDLGFNYKVNGDITVGTMSSHSASKPLGSITAGASYNAKFGTVKGKATSDGVLSAVLVKEVAKKVMVTPSVQVKAADFANATWGLGVTMG
eukprot:CAMPEP_0118643450 /NCGR_PEP_ID=MMETSP0785-20121206/6398_1 /TAXON_ID=91992 /ORGANISM="Bolidomonas pacifica, Strain CCMP 1866" /LENGTH=268 /DNA_ID=CAMNT_0006535115 /DNA_START=888 /DNA_END=1694 /DNA_ORIENTATION=-